MSASLVQELIRYPGSAAEGSHVFTPGVSVANGHHIILTIGLNVDYPDTTVSSITDSAGNSYSIDAMGGSPSSDSETLCIACGYIANALDDTDTITVTLSNASAIMTVEADEWSGLEPDPYDDGNIGNYSAATSHSSPSISPSQIGDLLVSAMVTVGGGGGEDPAPSPPSGGPVVANIWVDPVNGNDGTGSRSASKIEVDSANKFKSLHAASDACWAGDVVGLLPGVYSTVNRSAWGGEEIARDLSDGLANDVNPNSMEQTGTPVADPDSNWVTWIPGVENAEKDSIQLTPFAYPRLYFNADVHLIIDSSSSPGAIFIPSLLLGSEAIPASGGQLHTYDVHVQGIWFSNAHNIKMVRTENGPNILGYASGPNAIRASGSPIGIFEHGYAGRGTSDLSEYESPRIDNGSTNIRFEKIWSHDMESYRTDGFGGEGAHGGAGWFNWGNPGVEGNVVIDGMVVERCSVNGPFIEGTSTGLIMENCYFGVPVDQLDNVGGVWGVPVSGQPSLDMKNTSWNPTRWLIRNCIFMSSPVFNANGTFSLFRLIGNIFAMNWTSRSGMTIDYNVGLGFSPPGTNVLNVANPYTDTDPGQDPTTSSALDLHLTAGDKTFEDWIPNLGSDYTLAKDYFGQTRVTPITAGPSERGPLTFESVTAPLFGTYSTRDKGARIRNVPFTDEAGLYDACANMIAGDYIYYNGTGNLDITGHQFELDVISQPTGEVVLDLGDPAGDHVFFHGWPNLENGDADPNAANLFAIYIPFGKNLTIYGGEIEHESSSGLYLPHADTVKWWFFHFHNTGGACIDLVPNTANIVNCDFFGEVDNWGNHTEGDPHAEKGTGIHGCQFGDGAGSITNTRIVLYAHDGPTGAAIQYGSTGGVITGNTLILKAVNMTKVSTSQVAGNGVNLWGSETMSLTIPYIEATDCQGYAISVDSEFSLDFSDVVVEYGRANNTCINSSEWPPPSFMPGPTYQDVVES